jgi:hypothetical protein
MLTTDQFSYQRFFGGVSGVMIGSPKMNPDGAVQLVNLKISRTARHSDLFSLGHLIQYEIRLAGNREAANKKITINE